MATSDLPPRFLETARERREEARKFIRNWRGEAKLAYAFIAGDQWLAEDEAILKAQKRPPITFNYSEKMIDAVVGAEVSSRQEVTYAPRELNDAPIAELWTNAAKWVGDEGNFEDEESDAFRDALICGLGWTHLRMSWETDSDGMPVKDRIDPLEMSYDPAACKPGLTDRRYSFRDLWINESDFKRQWPGKVTLGSDDFDNPHGQGITRPGQGYNDENDSDPDNHKGQVKIHHYECVELRTFYKIFKDDGSSEDVEEKPESGTFVKLQKRVYYYAYFSGDTLLEADISPTQEGFTYGCITGKRDRNKNTWYGLTRVMMDPQRWANKWLSQILHIINSNAKGGLLAEINAFVDPQKAGEEWASPESITWLKEGALSGNKVKEKQMAQYPTGLDRLMEFALASLPQVTGINLEALGLAGREQANVLEQSRKQAAYGLLAPVFDSLRRYRKHQGRVLLDFINNYISDGRMIRIGGPESQQYIPLRKAPRAIHYDVIVDQSPNAPDVKRETWAVLETLIPAAMKAGMPIPPTVLKYAPIPVQLSLEWQKTIEGGMMGPEQVKKMQEELQKTSQENQKLQLQLKDKTTELQMDWKKMQAEHVLKIREMQLEMQIEMKKLQQELMIERAKAENEMTIAREKAAHDEEMQEKEVNANIDTRMVEVLQSGSNEATANIQKAINDLIGKISKLESESQD